MSRSSLQSFARRLEPRLQENINQSVAAEFEGMNRAVRAARAQLTDREWKKIQVVVMGSPLARADARFLQYFSRLLGVPAAGPSIIYCEGTSQESDAFVLSATYLVDREIGVAFFDEPTRMYRDLLGDAAREYLRKHRVPRL